MFKKNFRKWLFVIADTTKCPSIKEQLAASMGSTQGAVFGHSTVLMSTSVTGKLVTFQSHLLHSRGTFEWYLQVRRRQTTVACLNFFLFVAKVVPTLMPIIRTASSICGVPLCLLHEIFQKSSIYTIACIFHQSLSFAHVPSGRHYLRIKIWLARLCDIFQQGISCFNNSTLSTSGWAVLTSLVKQSHDNLWSSICKYNACTHIKLQYSKKKGRVKIKKNIYIYN